MEAKISLLEGHLSETDTATINKALEEARKAGIKEVVGLVQEMVRLLGKVVPADQNAMIDWAVKSQDSVYTNAGAAYYIAKAKLKEWGITLQ